MYTFILGIVCNDKKYDVLKIKRLKVLIENHRMFLGYSLVFLPFLNIIFLPFLLYLFPFCVFLMYINR